MPQKIWRKNFEIPRVDYQMSYPIMGEFYRSQVRLLSRAHVTESIWVTERGDNSGTYFPREQLRALVGAVIEKIVTDPAAVDKLHRKTVAYNIRYFRLSKQIERLKHERLTDRALLRWYREIMKWQTLSHGLSQPTTWFVDSDGEDFSNYLLAELGKKAAAAKVKESVAALFSLLTTPRKDSMARVEERELLKLVAAVQHDRRGAAVLRRPPGQLNAGVLQKLPPEIRHGLQRHYRKWRWVPYMYNGPPYEFDYYLEVVAGLLRQRVRPTTLLREYDEVRRRTRERQARAFEQLNVEPHLRQLFRVAQDIIYIKGFRKDCLYHGCYVRDLLLREVARRLRIALIQAKYLTPGEVALALLRKKFDADVLNERMKFSVIHMRRGQSRVLTGRRARSFLARQRFEKVVVPKVRELTGTCACPGKARGVIKVVNLPEETGKMKPGDIMLAHTTYPALVPAMRKAAAIVTEDGGITCHAAIVSRELKIPCVVGVRQATAVLRDGDCVAVDATKGTVRKV